MFSGLKLIYYSANKLLFNNKCFIIYNYHSVSKNLNNKFQSFETWTPLEYFTNQIVKIKKLFKIIPLYEGINRLNNFEIDDRYAAISFDDGYVSIQRNVLPILIKYNVPATFFINTAYLQSTKTCWFNVYQYLNHSEEDKRIHLTEEMHQAAAKLRYTMDSRFYNTYCKKIEALSYLIDTSEKMFVTPQFLESLDDRLFHTGLHGHEHQRFSMMPYEWQKKDIEKNIDYLSKLKAYRPIFAIPFGRPHDWNRDTIRICLEKKLEIVFADGGININKDIVYNRIPADGRDLKTLYLKELLQ